MTPQNFINNVSQYLADLTINEQFVKSNQTFSLSDFIICFFPIISSLAIFLFTDLDIIFCIFLAIFIISSVFINIASIYNYFVYFPQIKKKYTSFQQDCSYLYQKQFHYGIMNILDFNGWTKEEQMLFATCLEDKKITVPFLQLIQLKKTNLQEHYETKKQEQKKEQCTQYLIEGFNNHTLQEDTCMAKDKKSNFQFF